ncbi:hypothetical protein M569_10986 [Genlisea aurea]|uniref:RNase H type-1 domain-containing protein n=1 Tax=Genlisea aurea TaxID=192259 RepID=S8CGS0_9LAMI|nr:hypothetical protein M569_10986 [Genlisea aurea]
MKVKELILDDFSGLNIPKLQQYLHPSDIPYVSSIPLARNPYPDRMIWHHSKQGEYSVKSGRSLSSRPKFLPLDGVLAVWRLGGFLWDISDQDPLHPLDWLVSSKQQLRHDRFLTFLVTLWCIWRHRLDYRHNQVVLDPLRTHHMIQCYMESSAVETTFPLTQPPLPPLLHRRWEKPPAGFLKLNFDNGRCNPTGTGLGGLIRDSQGECLAWFSYYHASSLDPELGEALAARKTLELALAMKIIRVILEGDSFTGSRQQIIGKLFLARNHHSRLYSPDDSV